MENKTIEVLIALNAIRELHREEAYRLESEMSKNVNEQLDMLSRINSGDVDVEMVSQSGELTGRMTAIVDEQKFITKELSLINDLINVLTGNQEGEA